MHFTSILYGTVGPWQIPSTGEGLDTMTHPLSSPFNKAIAYEHSRHRHFALLRKFGVISRKFSFALLVSRQGSHQC